MQNYTFRLRPGQVFDAIEAFIHEKQVEADCILSGVGSLAGTLSIHSSHLHISFSDGDGTTIDSHLGTGCNEYTTVEIVIAVIEDVVYKREFAEDSGYDELMV